MFSQLTEITEFYWDLLEFTGIYWDLLTFRLYSYFSDGKTLLQALKSWESKFTAQISEVGCWRTSYS